MLTRPDPASVLVRNLLAARAEYDRASNDPDADFGAVTDALDDAVAAFTAHRCGSLPELADYAEALWIYIAAERLETEQWGDDATAPLWEFFPIAAAVEREFTRRTGPHWIAPAGPCDPMRSGSPATCSERIRTPTP